MSEFVPTWRYHKTEAPKIIYSQAELDALGSDWADNPAKFEQPEQKAEEVKAPQNYKEHQEAWQSKEEKKEEPKKESKPRRSKGEK